MGTRGPDRCVCTDSLVWAVGGGDASRDVNNGCRENWGSGGGIPGRRQSRGCTPQRPQVRDPARKSGRSCVAVVGRSSSDERGWPGNWESEKTAFQFHTADLKTPAGKPLMPLALDLFVLEEKHILHPGPPRKKLAAKPPQHETGRVRRNRVSCHRPEQVPLTRSEPEVSVALGHRATKKR